MDYKNLFSKTIKYFLLTIFCVILLFTVLNFLFPLRINIPYSQIVLADDGTIIHAFLSKDEKWRMMLDSSEITPQLKKAFLYKEDKFFYHHPGVNPVAIVRAVFKNIIRKKKTSGASTITMQLARLLNHHERTYLNKIIEIFRAMQLELHYSKDEILKMYFTIVPYGGNIEGIKASSLLYFGKTPNYLSPAQIITLTIIPNRPTSLRIGGNNSVIQKERNRWLLAFNKTNVFTKKEIEDAINEPLNAKRQEVPKDVPHFAYRLKSMYPDLPIIRTHLNKAKQDNIQNIARNHLKRLQLLNINNSAVIIVNNKTQAVEAYLGSPDYADVEHFGQVDGATAVRSPGSTLKPLVYALAFDKGLVTAKSVINDVPVNLNGYSPENFDMRYNGKITVERALAYSLNVPAVKTLDRLGTLSLIDKLKQAGFTQIKKDEKKLGLSIILGGCGVRLEELANLFSTFANQGNYRPLNYLKSDTTKSKSISIVSSAATFMVTDILTQLVRPDIPNNYQSSIHIPKIAWKTGTSYGRRDAWSIGYNKKYTVGVWVGNFSGQGVPELTGADMATPLLFDIFNSLEYNTSNEWFTMPEGLDFRLVCSESGMLPEDYCTNTVMDYFIPAISDCRKCEHLKYVYVSSDDSFSYCTACLPANGYKKQLYPNYEPELIAYYQSENISYQKIPSHNKNCNRIFTDKAPVITSLVNGKEYLIEKKEKQPLMLSCNADNEVKTIYWYINDRFYKSATVNEKVFFIPEAGRTKISCSDDRGKNTNIEIMISFY